MTKELPALTEHNSLRIIGNHDSSLVARSDLETLARMKKDFPPFLFDTLLPSEAESGGVEPRSPTPKNQGGRPLEHDWNGMTIEIIRIAHYDSLPEKQSELVNQLLQWFQDNYSNEPAQSSVKDRVSKIYKGLGLSRKRPQA
jgi:hypothetical protein